MCSCVCVCVCVRVCVCVCVCAAYLSTALVIWLINPNIGARIGLSNTSYL